MKNIFKYIKTRPLAITGVILLIVLYLIMIFAEFIAPYPATQSYENNTFHPVNVKITGRGLVAKEAETISMVSWKYAFKSLSLQTFGPHSM